jgi:signal transduction histidine kinase/DNA-binding NarL/FixJ family response regulator
MHNAIFDSDAWRTALDKYAEATGLTIRLYGADAEVALDSTHVTPIVALFREHAFDPGLFDACARRCLMQTYSRPIVFADEHHGLTVIGTSLVLEDVVVGAVVGGYALSEFPNISVVQRWARAARLPFYRLWEIMRRKSPVSERRLAVHGDLLKVLGDALLRESHRTQQHQDAVSKLKAAAAAKDDFLAVLSHELRAPLAPIVGWAGVMKKSESLEHVRVAAEAIERNALLQSRMVDDLLDTSRIAHRSISLDLQTQDLSALLRAAVEMSVEDMRRQAIRLEFTDCPQPLFVRGDAGRLQQVFRNIISNAVKFTPSEGSIRIAIVGRGEAAQVTVTDSGVGITPEFLPFVFDIFRQQEQGLRRKYDGLGIGLSLVKQLTELHQGTVAISSAGIGTGTEVTIRLPLVAEAPARRDAPAEAALQAAALAGLSILVVEHSEDAREFLRILLERSGATVSTARDGAEALETTRYFSPDVVFCDVRLPRMDGYEFLRELRQRPVHPPPVVAISGLASEDDLGRMREAGFHAHIKKPFDAAAVIAAVEAAVRYRKEQPPAALAPAAPQTPQPAGIADRKATRAERRSIARDAGDRSGGSAHGKTFSADRDDARQRASGSPKRHP